jgi:hypothetical protein
MNNSIINSTVLSQTQPLVRYLEDNNTTYYGVNNTSNCGVNNTSHCGVNKTTYCGANNTSDRAVDK